MAVEVVEVNGIDGLVAQVLAIRRGLAEEAFLWYRGHTRADHVLIPSTMRQGKSAEQIFDRERRLLTRFRQRSLPYWPSGYPQSDWEHLFAMQHYGIPTRLLDWSENLFIAAYFSLMGAGEDTTPTVWCMDPVSWNRSTKVLSEFGESIHVLTTSDDDAEAYRPDTQKRRNKSPVAIFGTHNSARIVAQRGTFVVWGEDPRGMEAFSEEMKCTLWCLRLKGAPVQLAKDLGSLGVGETMIYPELKSLANELAQIEGWRDVR